MTLIPGGADLSEPQIQVQIHTQVQTQAPVQPDPRAAAVLGEISELLRKILDEYGIDDAEIGMGTRFYDDLELESIDLVALAGLLRERYGEAVNFAEFIADLDLDQIIRLTVGELVEYVAVSLRAAEGG